MKPIALITGSTSGIGKATAQLLAQSHRLILCGRRENKLQSLKNELTTDVQLLCFDVRDKVAVNEAFDQLDEDWQKIDVLINNAGNAHGLSKIQEGSIDDWEAMIDSNVKGLLYVTKAVLPGMVARNRGHIVNIGSIAGVEVYPSGNVYCASKHAVDAINKGLRLDLNGHNIRVGSINPGLVHTEFSEVRFKGDSEKAALVYRGLDPLQAEDIAEIIAFVLSRPPHVNIADLLVLPTAQSSSTLVSRKG